MRIKDVQGGSLADSHVRCPPTFDFKKNKWTPLSSPERVRKLDIEEPDYGGGCMRDVDRLYAAIEDDAAFSRIAETAAAYCGTRSAMITHLDADGRLDFGQMNYWPADRFERYFAEFLGDDPWRRAADASGERGKPILLDGLLPPSAFFETTMYRELLKPLGDDTARCVGMFSPAGGDTLIVAAHRPYGAPAFDAEDAARLETLHGHVDRVLRLRRLLDRERTEVRDLKVMVDASGRAMLRVDRGLAIRQASAAAVALLDAADGLAVRQGTLVVEDGGAAQELRAAVASTIDHGRAGRSVFLCRRRSTRRAYRIVVLPGGADPRDGALLILEDPERGAVAACLGERLRHAYGATRAEAMLAEGLMRGLTLEEIAEQRKVGRETIRTQLRSLFQRTETRRQSELIILLAGMVR